MIEKRFKETISTAIVTDIVTGKEYNCEMRIDDDLLKLMNKLADENEQLKQENKELKMDKDSLATGFDEYQVQVAETLQKHYNQTLNTHIARFVKLLAEELGIDLQ